MKRIWLLIGSFLLGAPIRATADATKTDPTPKVEESTPDSDKAAVRDASSDAEKWAASHPAEKNTAENAAPAADVQTPHSKVQTPPSKVEASPTSPTPDKVVAPAPPPSPQRVARTGLNEMRGKLLEKSYDPKAIRLTVDGGLNVEFTWDSKTSVVNGGSSISIDDLNYNDELIIRYSGMDLTAIEIDRVSKAPRPE